jgi:hypothetical protein
MDLLTLEQRLRENVHHARLFGDYEARRAERNTIIYELNRLLYAHIGTSFTDLEQRHSTEGTVVDSPLPVEYNVVGEAIEIAVDLAAVADTGSLLIGLRAYRQLAQICVATPHPNLSAYAVSSLLVT